MHGGLAQLFRVHLAQALEPADMNIGLPDTAIGQPLQYLVALALVQCVQAPLRPTLALRRHLDAIERRLGDVDMSLFDQAGKVAQEQGQQQGLDVAAIDIGVGHDDDLAVAQLIQHRVGRIQVVRVQTQGHGDVMHLVVAEYLVARHFPGVQHLAAQRQDGLVLAVAALLGGTAGGIALDQKNFVAADLVRFAIGQLARQHCGAGLLLLLHHPAGLLPRQRRLDRQLGDLFTDLDIAVQPAIERVLDS